MSSTPCAVVGGSYQADSASGLVSARRWFTGALVSGGVGAVSLLVLLTAGSPAAFAAQSPVGLGTAKTYAVLAGSTVTNTGSSVIRGDIGLSPGSSVTGFPPGTQPTGTMHVTTAAAGNAKRDLKTAYNDAAGRTPANTVTGNLGGQTLTAGVYKSSSAMSVTGPVALTLKGGPDDVFIFQAGSTLTTGPNSSVRLIGGVSACNVFWQVGSSATLDTNTTFVGTVMAMESATLNTGTTVQGRILARGGAVTLDTNTITVPNCSDVTSSPSVSPSPTATGTSPTSTATPTPTATPTSTATGTAAGGAGGTDSGSGGNGTGTGSGSGSVIPLGHPETGEGGAAASDGHLLLLVGGLGIAGAGFASARAVRRPSASRPSHR